MLNIFQTQDFYFFRKPHWVASAFWKEKSFLDYVFIDHREIPSTYLAYKDLDNDILEHIKQQIKNLNITSPVNRDQQDQIINNLIDIFWEEQEYWLLNRLDNDTWGLLYFAKSLEIYHKYKSQQREKLLKKFYVAQVIGNPLFKLDTKELDINYPIMHHKFSEDRMICVMKPSDIAKWEWRQHNVSTRIFLLYFDKSKNISTLLVSISKWIRHQIRVHLSSIGCPILWENIYSKHKIDDFLHLWSIGFK